MQSSEGERITPAISSVLVGVVSLPNFTTPTLSSPPSFSPSASQGQPQPIHLQRPALLAPTPIRYRVPVAHAMSLSRVSSQQSVKPSASAMKVCDEDNGEANEAPTEKVRRSLRFEGGQTLATDPSHDHSTYNVNSDGIISVATSNAVSPSYNVFHQKPTAPHSQPNPPASLSPQHLQMVSSAGAFSNNDTNENYVVGGVTTGSNQSLTSNLVSPFATNDVARRVSPRSIEGSNVSKIKQEILKNVDGNDDGRQTAGDVQATTQQQQLRCSSFRKPTELSPLRPEKLDAANLSYFAHISDRNLDSKYATQQESLSTTKGSPQFTFNNSNLSPARTFGSFRNISNNVARSPRTHTYNPHALLASGSNINVAANRRKSLGAISPSSSIMKIELSKPPTVAMVGDRLSSSRAGSPRSFVSSFYKAKASPVPTTQPGSYALAVTASGSPSQKRADEQQGLPARTAHTWNRQQKAHPTNRAVIAPDHSWCPLTCQSPIQSISGNSPKSRSLSPHHMTGIHSATRSPKAVAHDNPLATLSPNSAMRRQQEFLQVYGGSRSGSQGDGFLEGGLSTQQPSRALYEDDDDEDIQQVATIGATTASEGRSSPTTTAGTTPTSQHHLVNRMGNQQGSSSSTPGSGNKLSSAKITCCVGLDVMPGEEEKDAKRIADNSVPSQDSTHDQKPLMFEKIPSNQNLLSQGSKSNLRFNQLAMGSDSTSAYYSRGDPVDFFLHAGREAGEGGAAQKSLRRQLPSTAANTIVDKQCSDGSGSVTNLFPTLGAVDGVGRLNASTSRHPTSSSSGTAASTQVFQSSDIQHSDAAAGASSTLTSLHNVSSNTNSAMARVLSHKTTPLTSAVDPRETSAIHNKGEFGDSQVATASTTLPSTLPPTRLSTIHASNSNGNSRRLSFSESHAGPHQEGATVPSTVTAPSTLGATVTSSPPKIAIKPLDANIFTSSPSTSSKRVDHFGSFRTPFEEVGAQHQTHSDHAFHPSRSGNASFSRNDMMTNVSQRTPSYRRVQSVVLSGVGGKRIGGTIGASASQGEFSASTRKRSLVEESASAKPQDSNKTVMCGGKDREESSDDDEWFAAAHDSNGPQLTTADVAQAMGITEEEVVLHGCGGSGEVSVSQTGDAFGHSAYLQMSDNGVTMQSSGGFGTPQQTRRGTLVDNYVSNSPRQASRSPQRSVVGGQLASSVFGSQHRPPPAHVMVISPQRLEASQAGAVGMLHLSHLGREGAIAPMPTYSPRRPANGTGN